MTTWTDIGPVSEFPPTRARPVETVHGHIAVFRTGDDHFYALTDRCPHKGGPLSQGLVFGRFVACPLHNWRIDLQSGEAVAPDAGCAGRFEVRVVNGMVQLLL